MIQKVGLLYLAEAESTQIKRIYGCGLWNIFCSVEAAVHNT